MRWLSSIRNVWIAGLLLSFLLVVMVNLASGGPPVMFRELVFVRWLHIVAGILWVGLLYYFNFVQMPALAEAQADSGGPGPLGIGKYIVPRALAWFRWASLVTWAAGVWYLVRTGQLHNVFGLGLGGGSAAAYGLTMGIGAWLGTILLANVWLLLWPNQKKLMGLTPVAGPQELAHAKTVVTTVARINAVLSLPMLLFMVVAGHGGQL